MVHANKVFEVQASRPVTTFFYPGLGNDRIQAQRYSASSGFPGALGLLPNIVPIQPYDAHDVFRFNVAQQGDVQHALTETRRQLEARPGKDERFILFGTSRGAAVALQVAHNLTADELKRVAFVVCEGVFDTAPAVMESRFGSRVTRFLQWALPKICEYRAESSPTPLQIAREFAHVDLPLLLVTSRADIIVPPQHTQAMADVLKTRNKKTTLLQLEHSPHSSMATWDDRDRQTYAQTMQLMFKLHLVA